MKSKTLRSDFLRGRRALAKWIWGSSTLVWIISMSSVIAFAKVQTPLVAAPLAAPVVAPLAAPVVAPLAAPVVANYDCRGVVASKTSFRLQVLAHGQGSKIFYALAHFQSEELATTRRTYKEKRTVNLEFNAGLTAPYAHLSRDERTRAFSGLAGEEESAREFTLYLTGKEGTPTPSHQIPSFEAELVFESAKIADRLRFSCLLSR